MLEKRTYPGMANRRVGATQRRKYSRVTALALRWRARGLAVTGARPVEAFFPKPSARTLRRSRPRPLPLKIEHGALVVPERFCSAVPLATAEAPSSREAW